MSGEISDEKFDVTIGFVAPDTWEVRGPGTLQHPEHVIISGDLGWEQVGSTWREYPRVKAMRETLLSFVSTVDRFDSTLRLVGNGPRYNGEATLRFLTMMPLQPEPIPAEINGHRVPPDTIATLTALYKDATIKSEIHVGVASKLIYHIRATLRGPHSDSITAYTFDYNTPVSITLPS